ncbi:MAG TPA: prenyltransferase/squalene oxidase repeat-containing protein [Tepidisphaeraceae bacterium]|nr:prenyltransferase/squalene oxidase repeat-containing protein [Tepidisphaeraceae bacterium]
MTLCGFVPPAQAQDPQDAPVAPAAAAAVDKALDWLKSNQQPTGDWPHGDTAGSTAVPSLAVMAFLARGQVPGQGPYGDVINKAIDFVVASQRTEGARKGLLARDDSNAVMYEHGIATVMLTEVYGMVDDARRARIDKALALAVQVILDAQSVQKSDPKDRGGWRYTPRSADSDISCTGWQLMALRGAANCGAAVPADVLKNGLEYVKRCVVPAGGFSYQASGGSPNQARTGTGILSLVLIGGDRNAPEVTRAGDYLLHDPPDHSIEFYYYAIYYDSQALNQLGGTYWQTLYPKLVNHLLSLQQPDGAFAPEGGGQETDAGPAYRTSMAVLALCVPYRYLPLYQAEK